MFIDSQAVNKITINYHFQSLASKISSITAGSQNATNILTIHIPILHGLIDDCLSHLSFSLSSQHGSSLIKRSNDLFFMFTLSFSKLISTSRKRSRHWNPITFSCSRFYFLIDIHFLKKSHHCCSSSLAF